MHPFDELVDVSARFEEFGTIEKTLAEFSGLKQSFEKVVRHLNLDEKDLSHTQEVAGGEQWRSELFICAVSLSGTEGDRSRVVAAKFKWLLDRVELELAALRRAA